MITRPSFRRAATEFGLFLAYEENDRFYGRSFFVLHIFSLHIHDFLRSLLLCGMVKAKH